MDAPRPRASPSASASACSAGSRCGCAVSPLASRRGGRGRRCTRGRAPSAREGRAREPPLEELDERRIGRAFRRAGGPERHEGRDKQRRNARRCKPTTGPRPKVAPPAAPWSTVGMPSSCLPAPRSWSRASCSPPPPRPRSRRRPPPPAQGSDPAPPPPPPPRVVKVKTVPGPRRPGRRSSRPRLASSAGTSWSCRPASRSPARRPSSGSTTGRRASGRVSSKVDVVENKAEGRLVYRCAVPSPPGRRASSP